MRPHLHPDMGQTVICARVAVQLTAVYYRHGQDYQLSPSSAAQAAASHLPPDYPGFLRFALHSLAVYLNLAMPSQVWLSNVLTSAHYGHPFRRCFFFDYKENRRPYPRVTNRGVQNSLVAETIAWQEKRRNA